jgi:hypothetical protein
MEKTYISEEKSKTMFSTIHYMITFIFFLFILINTIILSKSILNMEVGSHQTDMIQAKNVMIATALFGYIEVFFVLGIVFLTGDYHLNKDDYDNKNGDLTFEYIKQTGGENVYSSSRIVIFSSLMLVSLIMGILSATAYQLIDESGEKKNYEDQYTLTKEIAKTFILHFLLFTALQGGSILWQKMFDESHGIKDNL